jgi:FAD/FMN-containing dehydrogenase
MPVSPSSAAPLSSRGVSRRSLLRATGIGAAGFVTAPWLKGLAAADEATPVATLSDTAWDDLASRLSGRLLRPGDAMYPAATVINAARYMGAGPAGIAVCASPEDAASCVRWARGTGAPFAVRSGGHSYAGFSNSDGLVIDVKGMRAVSVDPATDTVTVAGGASNTDVGAGLQPYGVYFPGGRCPTVGVSGLTLGGGWGLSCRHLGMTCDTLLSTDVVTASGEIVTASETEHPDLFWAVRGAGGGNFGVHTSFTYKVTPVRDVTTFSLSWSGGDTAALVDAIMRMQVAGPPELGLRLNLRSPSRLPRSQPAPVNVDTVGLYWGPPAEMEALLAPVEQIQAPAARTVAGQSFWAAREFLSATTPLGTYAVKSGFVRGPMAAAGITTMLEWITMMPGVPSREQEGPTVLYGWGARVNDVAPDATAFVHRNADLLFKCEAIWSPEDDPNLIADNLDWLEGYRAAMQPYLAGGAYQNFPDRTQADWQHAYYGENFPRLVETKRTWDPDNLFRFGQSIPVSASPASG